MAASKSQKGRKIGRNKASCEAYRREDRSQKNAVLKAARHERDILKKKNRAAAKAVPDTKAD